VRSRTFTPKKPPRFNQKDTESVTFCGELPFQYRGKVTPTLYVWTDRRKTRPVDRRDLPGLIDDAGIDNLDSGRIRERKEQLKQREVQRAQKRKERQAPEPAQIEQEVE